MRKKVISIGRDPHGAYVIHFTRWRWFRTEDVYVRGSSTVWRYANTGTRCDVRLEAWLADQITLYLWGELS